MCLARRRADVAVDEQIDVRRPYPVERTFERRSFPHVCWSDHDPGAGGLRLLARPMPGRVVDDHYLVDVLDPSQRVDRRGDRVSFVVGDDERTHPAG